METKFERQPIYSFNQGFLSIPEIENDSSEAIITEQTITSYRNVLLTPTNHIFVNGKYVPTGLFTTNDNKKLSFGQKLYFYYKFKYLTTLEKLGGVFLLTHDAWSTNYYHWICESLPRLFMMHREHPMAMVLLPETFRRYHYIESSLQILGINIRWINPQYAYSVQQLITVQTNPRLGNVNPTVQKELKDELLSVLGKRNEFDPTRKVFVSRSKAAYRNISNEREIIPILKKYGYELICTEELTFLEQIQLFYQTSAIISLHGAGLTNIMFMNEGSKMLEIRNNEWSVNPLCFWRLANILNIKWKYFMADSVGEVSNFNNISIDIHSFEKELQAFESL